MRQKRTRYSVATEARRNEMPEEKEWVEGFGTIQVSEPTTVCDVARTFSYITRETPAVKEVEEFLGEFGYIDGTYDEDGGWTPPCPLRKRHSFGTFIPKEKATDKDARWVLSLNLLDASIEYRRCCPEVAGKLKGLHDKLERELKEEEK